MRTELLVAKCAENLILKLGAGILGEILPSVITEAVEDRDVTLNQIQGS